MKIAFISSECVPFAKTGGLADVAGALPDALKHQKHDICVIMPKYKMISDREFSIRTLRGKVNIHMDGAIETAKIKYKKEPQSVPVYFVDNKNYYYRDELYRTSDGDYEDNAQRFIFFSRAVLEILKKINFQPDIIHCNDWQTGLIPAYLKILYKDDPFFSKTGTVFTIHNIAYQGIFPKDIMPLTGLGWDEFVMEKMEFWDQINFLKTGIVYSDAVTTVSPTYSHEIQTDPKYGMGLEGVLLDRRNVLYGIINGVDYNNWNPKTDKFIKYKYDLKNMSNKSKNKVELLKENKLPVRKNVPLIGFISRLDPQKGLDIISEAMDKLMKLDIQFILLGTGDQVYHNMFEQIEKRYPGKMKARLEFNNAVAHKIYAGCDIFLMPSHFEPCGLGQMISFKYGTVPLVHKTGGLADTVDNYSPGTQTGKGFVFKEYSAKGLLKAVKKALKVFEDKKRWEKLISNGMKADFSWDASTRSYVKLYKKILTAK